MRKHLTLLALAVLSVGAITPSQAASKKGAEKAKAAAKADQRKKPQKTVNLISQYRLEYHKKSLPSARAGRGGKGDANCTVDDVFQKTFIVSKTINKNVSGTVGAIYKFNLNESQSDNVTILAGFSRTLSKKAKASVNYVSNDKYDVLDNGQKNTDSETLAFALSYKFFGPHKKGQGKRAYMSKDGLSGGISYAGRPNFDVGGTLTPKLDWSHTMGKRLSGSLGVSMNYDMKSRDNRTNARGVVSARNTLNAYGVDFKYKLNVKQDLAFGYQLKDFATGPEDHVMRFTLTHKY